MKRHSIVILAAISALVFALSRCKKDDCPPPESWSPTYYTLEIPVGFPTPNIPADNPMTYEGIELGHRLFFDKLKHYWIKYKSLIPSLNFLKYHQLLNYFEKIFKIILMQWEKKT